MAVVVSHAMRRFPTTPPDAAYAYGLRPEPSTHKHQASWSNESESESALSRSMRYADPWLYGSVRAPAGLVLAPAFVLCSCPDYINGTKRSSKKSPTTCKKCKGTRLPIGDSKFGTMRCYPTSNPTAVSTPLRAGTLRVVSTSSRPSILPTSDPYDLMRRSRLSVSEGSSQFRARSISPGKAKNGDGRSHSSSRSKNSNGDAYSTLGRRSILECDINPYELMSTESRDSSITLVNGQRIRVRPSLGEAEFDEADNNKKSQIPIKSLVKNNKQQLITKINEKESELNISSNCSNNNNRFKSILKKRATTFSDTDTSGLELRNNNQQQKQQRSCNVSKVSSPSPAQNNNNKSGSHFYLPMPGTAPRKKVQFLVENETEPQNDDGSNVYSNCNYSDGCKKPQEIAEKTVEDDSSTDNKICTLKRSASECSEHESQKVVFNDTMALRSRQPRADSRITFGEEDLQRLDGLRTTPRKKSPTKLRPTRPPPPPPTAISVEPKAAIKNNKKTKQHANKEAVQQKSQQQIKPAVKNNVKKKNDNIEDIKVAAVKEKQTEAVTLHSDENKNAKEPPPSAPPRKRSNNKQPSVNNLVNESNAQISPNKTVVQITSTAAAVPSVTVHKLQIKNEFSDSSTINNNGSNIQTVNVSESPQRKTSIMITGDDCYSTVNVNDDIPLYQSSVVVKDTFVTVDTMGGSSTSPKKSSSVYITGNFEPIKEEQQQQQQNNKNKENLKETKRDCNNSLVDTFNENDIPSSERLKELLRDPVEAVKRNLVPHVCGKSDAVRTRRDKKFLPIELAQNHAEDSFCNNLINYQGNIGTSNLLEDSLMKLTNYESIMADDLSSEHSSSTQYEFVDASSECYTDHSNRSSVTEEELANRTKFYELLADSAIVEVAESDDHHYESIKLNQDPIYEEIEIPPPLPANPPPSTLLDDLHLDKEYTTRSIFEGASKYDILSYLVDAKERGIVPEDSYTFNFATNSHNSSVSGDDDTKEPYNRASHMSTVSDSSEDNSLILSSSLIDDKFQKTAEVERNDSGVGSETSKSSLSKYRIKPENSTTTCEDCEVVIESTENEPLICRKCAKKRSERKEIITEIVETEEKYSRDLQIILEEFYQPMLVAGLLTPEQLAAIFLNAEELLENSQSLAERLRDAVEIAVEQGDEDLLTVNIGKLFLEAAPMLHGFETYCVRQGAASLLLASLEKEKELLRIFLRVSQMENTMLRRMNLNSFLMVPVQRVTKYPLLLARLYKVTPAHHETKEQLKEAQHKIELHLNHMNSETKDVPSKLWRRIGSSSGRRSSAEMDLVNIKLRKIAVDVLEWNHDEAKFALEGKLLFTQPTDNNWRKGRTIKLTPVNALLVINGKPSQQNRAERNDENGLIFSRHSATRDAALLLVRDKNGRYSLLREPLYLDRCVIAADPAWQSYFEVQELLGKDTFIFKAEDEEQTKLWYTQLQYHAQGMGAWRKRRNALANIMINGMGLRS